MRRRKLHNCRVYTFKELVSIFRWGREWSTKRVFEGYVLYGNVLLQTYANRFSIAYSGGGTRFPIADVYRASDDDTVYVVHGIGGDETDRRSLPSSSPQRKRLAFLWAKYVPLFTPLPHGESLDATQAVYRLQANLCGLRLGTNSQENDPQGVWLATNPCDRMSMEDWIQPLLGFGTFARRCRTFAIRLKKACLAMNALVKIQLLCPSEATDIAMPPDTSFHLPACACLEVCTPPTHSQNGRRIVVKICRHGIESRAFFRVDENFAQTHNQFFALEEGAGHLEQMRWKCGKDAIDGVKEWLIGDIHIPGPG